ncbi:hypothetical protein CN558_12525 [Bacillus wiedmannii]|uniref:DUF2164 domain-containing protein n=1 Tax=Bacillus cereus group TaxID=86661 RepID=UPI000BEDAABC|nr:MULTISPECIES: DUF2164 domain-containing protein [Bacillus cereus group]PDY49541.1 hypothetical protein CON61_30115 [Bacillus toyonensis]PEM81503.1 hypothetical protein CN627_28255 [Bacillus wiedmannii]PEO86069.1 hypothetical protein CN558_12525 [Bacillus wiedmannii]
MPKLKKLNRENQEMIKARLEDFFYKKFELDLSSLEAEYILEFMMKELGPHIYNQAVEDACKTLRLQMDVLEEEIYVLQVPIN